MAQHDMDSADVRDRSYQMSPETEAAWRNDEVLAAEGKPEQAALAAARRHSPGPWDGVDLSDLTERLIAAINTIPGVSVKETGAVMEGDHSGVVGFRYGGAPISLDWRVTP